MNWDDYRFFLYVAREEQLSAAGKKMGVDHATVSRRIKSLERQLKSKLFHSSPQGYQLTNDGRKLLTIAETIEKATIQAESIIEHTDERIEGQVRIGVPDGVGAYLISSAAINIREKHPDLHIQLMAMPRQFSLSKREVDFAISVSSPGAGRIKKRKIADYNLHLYASKTYLEHAPKIRSVDDLSSHPGVGYVSEYVHDKELDYAPLIHPDFKLQLTSTSVHVQLQAILKGAGVGVVHDFMAQHHDELIPVLENEISFTRTFWLSVHEDYAKVERIRIAIDEITKYLKSELKEF